MHIHSSIVADISKVQSRLSSEASITKLSWNDSVADRFYKEYIDEYIYQMDLYIKGGSGVDGMGVAELVDYLNERGEKMEQLL